MYDTFIGFSQILPRIMTIFGLVFSMIALLGAVFVFINVFIAPPLVLGWSSLMIAITLFSGITFFMLGVMSEYLARIHVESTRRPIYFVAAETHPQARPERP